MAVYCWLKGRVVDILLESVVKRRCRLALASFGDGCRAVKYVFGSLGDAPLGEKELSTSEGDRRLGKRSSSMRPLRELEKAMVEVYTNGLKGSV